MIDRSTSPALCPLSVPELLPFRKEVLDNGIEVVYIHDPAQNVFKADIQFEAGIYYQSRPLIASTAINMLNEGTSRHTAEEIADLFDYYGAYIDFNCGLNKTELSLISLSRYAGQTLAMMAELLTDSVIPEKELEIYLRNKRQEHLVNREKTAYLAKCRFSELLFGQDHPYANPVCEDDFCQVDAGTVRDFYHRHIHAGNCRIILCGNVDETLLQIVRREFSRLPVPAEYPELRIQPFSPSPVRRAHCPKENTVQSSIRIGRQGVRLGEGDYAGFMLLNTVLGGYFGSRLMSNIREEKGYTYGINSFNVSLPQGSFWCIAADVNSQYTEAALEEVRKEIVRLQTEPVGNEELELVKNFMHGDLLREVDGVFAQSDALKHKLDYGLDNTVYARLIEEVKACTPEELLHLAGKYLRWEDMYVVTAGK